MGTSNFKLGQSSGYVVEGSLEKIPANDNVIEALISGNPTIEAAVADLVDNSIDAKARTIEIRLHRKPFKNDPSFQPLSISVWDDGKGMDRVSILEAVKLSGDGKKDTSTLGKFGVGLKAASFSKSLTTSIFSKTEVSGVVGVELSGTVGDRRFGQLVETASGSGFERSFSRIPAISGTIVRWEAMRGIPSMESESEVRNYIQDLSQRLNRHLGIVFHNFLSDEFESKTNITILQVDENGGVGIPSHVKAIAPICKNEPNAEIHEFTVSFNAHQFPIRLQISLKNSKFDILEKASGSINGSGMYIYRNNRVVQIGGWDGVLAAGNRDFRLMRVEIQIPVAFELDGNFSVAHQKNSCVMSDNLRNAILEAKDPLTQHDLRDFAAIAERKQKASLPRALKATKLVRVMDGLPADLIKLINAETIPAGTPISIVIVDFPANNDDVFQLESAGRKLLINKKFAGTTENEKQKFVSSIFLLCQPWLGRDSLSAQNALDIATFNRLLLSAIKEV